MITIFRTGQALFRSGLMSVAVLVLVSGQVQAQQATPQTDVTNNKLVERGKFIYRRFCSICHGRKLEGEKDWRRRKPDGRLPAPPHDETGHTWHHPDDKLFEMTKFGMVPPNAPQGYASDMPAWQGTLTDGDIWAVITFIKSTWPEDILRQQQEINRQSIINRE